MLNQVIYFKRRGFQAPLLLSKVGRSAGRYFSFPPLLSSYTNKNPIGTTYEKHDISFLRARAGMSTARVKKGAKLFLWSSV